MNITTKLRSACVRPDGWDVEGLSADAADEIDNLRSAMRELLDRPGVEATEGAVAMLETN